MPATIELPELEIETTDDLAELFAMLGNLDD